MTETNLKEGVYNVTLSKDKIYKELSNDDYHKDKAIGSSGLKAFKEIPALYEWQYLLGNKSSGTSTMELGSAMHSFLLEPGLFCKEYRVSTLNNRRGNAWKDFVAECEADNKKPILQQDYEALKNMRESLFKNSLCAKILDAYGEYECSFFHKDEATGLMTKSRPDKISQGIMIDLKTTEVSLGASSYSRTAYNLDRQLQAYHHKNVVEKVSGETIDAVWHIVVSTKPPHLSRIFNVPMDWLEMGKDQVEMLLRGIAECEENKHYPGYNEDEPVDLILPMWAGTEIN